MKSRWKRGTGPCQAQAEPLEGTAPPSPPERWSSQGALPDWHPGSRGRETSQPDACILDSLSCMPRRLPFSPQALHSLGRLSSCWASNVLFCGSSSRNTACNQQQVRASQEGRACTLSLAQHLLWSCRLHLTFLSQKARVRITEEKRPEGHGGPMPGVSSCIAGLSFMFYLIIIFACWELNTVLNA